MNITLLKNSNYVKLLFATIITRFGDAVDSIALSWLVYIMTGSKVLMGTLFAVSFIPNIITLPIAGVVADIVSKKKLVVLSDLGRGVSVTAMALIYYFGLLQIWHLFFFVILNSFLESFANPARSAIMPSIIDEEDFVAGSSYLTSVTTLGEIIGISLVGVIIGVFGVWLALLIDGITFFISAIIILSMRFLERINKERVEISYRNFALMIKEGFSYVRRSKQLLSVLLLAAFINFSFVPYNVLRPIYVDEVLKVGSEGMSFLGLGLLVGMLVGSVIVGKIGNKFNKIASISIAISFMSINYALMGLAGLIQFSLFSPLIYATIVSFFFGLFLPFAQSPIKALLMENTEKEKLGRVTSIFSLVSLGAVPIGGAVVGVVGEYVSVSNLFIIMGIAGFLVSLAFAIKNCFNLREIQI